MPYQAEISRANPSCFLFLIDQSGSMSDPFGGGESTKKKADALADGINKILQNLVIKCAKGDDVLDRLHVGVIGYGNSVNSAFAGSLAGRDLVAISEIAKSPSRIEVRTKKIDDGAGGLVDQTIKFPIWFDPIANGGTPMCQALAYAKAIVQNWIGQHPSSFPPVVMHFTDGESTDGNPSDIAKEIKQLSTNDGNVLLFNVHLSSTRANPLVFPDNETELPDEFAHLLFNMSSTLPPAFHNVAREFGYNVSEATRGFAFNADLVSVVQFLEIGTRPSNLR
jgi:uncharacterized protein YegL